MTAILLSIAASAAPQASQPPRLILLIGHVAGAPAPPVVGERIDAALRNQRVEIVPGEDVNAAIRGLGRGVNPTQPASMQLLCRELHADGVVVVRAVRRSDVRAGVIARVQVFGPEGDPRTDIHVAWPSVIPSVADANTIAIVASQGTRLPPPVDRSANPTQQNADAAQVPDEPVEPYPTLPIIPNPTPLGLTQLSAAPTITWRSASGRLPLPMTPEAFGATSPYFGLDLRLKSFPFTGRVSRYFGFGLDYSFAALRVGTTAMAGTSPMSDSTVGTEQRFTGDLIGLWPTPVAGGRLELHLGIAYEGFFIPPGFPQASTTFLSPDVRVDYSHPLPFGLAIDVQGGLRPAAFPGAALKESLGPQSLALGVEASATLSGPFTSVLPDLRWMGGYDFLYYTNEISGRPESTMSQQMYNRLIVGISWQLW